MSEELVPHEWSLGFPVYEGLQGCVCRGCGGRVLTTEEAPTDEELEQAGLPKDCLEAVPAVLHEEYRSFDPEDCWEEEDVHRRPVWPEPRTAGAGIRERPGLSGPSKATLQSVEAVEAEGGKAP